MYLIIARQCGLQSMCYSSLSSPTMPAEPDPFGEDADHVMKRRTLILKEHADAVLDVKNRAVIVYGEMVLREIEYLVMCGWDKVEAYLPAVNNLAVRRVALQDELFAELGRLQGELRRKMQRLAEELEDLGEQ